VSLYCWFLCSVLGIVTDSLLDVAVLPHHWPGGCLSTVGFCALCWALLQIVCLMWLCCPSLARWVSLYCWFLCSVLGIVADSLLDVAALPHHWTGGCPFTVSFCALCWALLQTVCLMWLRCPITGQVGVSLLLVFVLCVGHCCRQFA
jgi:hypothetical protein